MSLKDLIGNYAASYAQNYAAGHGYALILHTNIAPPLRLYVAQPAGDPAPPGFIAASVEVVDQNGATVTTAGDAPPFSWPAALVVWGGAALLALLLLRGILKR